MSENQVKISKKKKEKIWHILVCLLLAGILFVFLLNVEKRQLENFEKGLVVVAVEEVADNTEITPENAAVYFALEERTLTDIPKAAYTDIQEVIGFYAKGGIDKGSMVTKSMLGKLGNVTADSVFLSVDMEALDQSVAGTLRAGDQIDIYTVKKGQDEEVEVAEVLSSVIIERSYTSSGIAIQKEDTTAIAQYVMIPIHKDAVEAFYEALENKKIQIVKHPD